MSASTLCKNCQKDAVGEEICPSCFAPQVQRLARYTMDSVPTARGQTIPPISVNLPDLQTASFRPSSRLSRNLTKVRGGIATGLVLGLVALVALFLGFRSEKAQAHEADQIASAAFEERKFEEAARFWLKAAGHYESVFDNTGESVALRKSSEAYLKGELFQESLELIEQSGKLSGAPYEEKQAKIYRIWANHDLEESRQYSSIEAFELALKAAADASRHYELGQGSDEQFAAAHRESALTLAELEDFSSAREHIKAAVDLEGRTKSNIQASNKLKRQRLAYEKSRLAASKEHRYISDKDIPIVKTKAPVQRPKRATSAYRRPVNTSPRPNRPSLGKTANYPTRRKTYPTYQNPSQSQTYQATTFRPAPRPPQTRQPNVYKPPYKPPTSYPRATQHRSSSSGPTTWSGVQKRPMGGSGSSRYR